MNFVLFKRGKIVFTHNLYYLTRPPDLFLVSHWMTPWGLLLPMGAPATAMRNFIFNSNQLPDEKACNCHTGLLIEPDGRICTVEFDKRPGKDEIDVFKDYRNTEKDNTWIVSSNYSANQSLAMLMNIVEEPKDILPLLANLHEFNPEGYTTYDYAELVKLVKDTVDQFKEKEAPDAIE